MADKFVPSPQIARLGAVTLLTSQPCALKHFKTAGGEAKATQERFRTSATILDQIEPRNLRNFKAEMDSFIKHEIRQVSSDTEYCSYLEKERYARDARQRNHDLRLKRIARIQEEDALKQMVHRNNLPFADSDNKQQAKTYPCVIPDDEAAMTKWQKERLHPVPIDADALDRLMNF